MTTIRAQEGAKRFISSSGGNAGIAVAYPPVPVLPLRCHVLALFIRQLRSHPVYVLLLSYCGGKLGVPVTVVVPSTASARAGSSSALQPLSRTLR